MSKIAWDGPESSKGYKVSVASGTHSHGVTRAVRGSKSGGREFERFENLTRKLMDVSKAELDEKRKTD